MINIKANMFVLLLTAVALSACTRETNPAEDGRNGDVQPGTLERPIIRNNTVYTAWGTPIRGTLSGTASEYPNDPHLKDADFNRMVNNGYNALHLYSEGTNSIYPIGVTSAYTDYLVDLAEKYGIYVILTVGGVSGRVENYEAEMRFINEFWEFYAPRYRDRKHVIFEVCNEYGSDKGLDWMTKAVAENYSKLRRLAPKTMIFVWTFANTIGVDEIPEWWIKPVENQVSGGIPWTNEAIAIHSYECMEEGTDIFGGETYHRHVIKVMTGAGYPIINTEVPCRHEHSNYPDVSMYRVLEEKGIAWTGFVDCIRTGAPSYWRGQMEAAGIAWTPDYGNWPVPDAVFPFKPHAKIINIIEGGKARLDKLNFGTRIPTVFTASVKTGSEGIIEIRSADGTLIGSSPVEASDRFSEVSIYLLNPLNGVADIDICYTNYEGGGAILYIKEWEFSLPKQEVYSYPYETVFAADYPFRTGNIFRRMNTDPASAAPMNVTGIRHGSSLVFDFVWFDRHDKNLHIRAKTLAGGKITLYAGDFASMNETVSELGVCEINGARGVWTEFTCPLTLNSVFAAGDPWGYWDLHLKFESLNGNSGSAELFELSEFVFR